jgi:UDP-N-acetyl-D-glucosamine dehydrogenase
LPIVESEPTTDRTNRLREAIDGRTATVAVMGLGYVGLPLLAALFDTGYPVIGYDVDGAKLERLRAGENYLAHLGPDLARGFAGSERFHATSDPADLSRADVVVICVPTPLGEHREPDLSFVTGSARSIAGSLRPGQLVILTSTTYPGTTRDEVLPILEETGLSCGEDFFLAFSPEREDPGRAGVTTATIPRLVGGVDDVSTELATALLGHVVREVHPVDSAEIAESAKLLENIFRAVNIALVNELKVLMTEMGIDVWKVIAAADTKPFGFQAFYPGPGLGGHCIPIDPFYLTWKAKEVGLHTRFIELAGEVNTQMPAYVVRRVMEALNEQGKPLRGSKVLLAGVAYKRDVGDIREAPAAEIIERLTAAGAQVSYHDPHIPDFPAMRKHTIELSSVELSPELLASQDCVLVVTDHQAIDWRSIGRHSSLVVDTRNVMSRTEGVAATVVPA